VCTLSGTEPGPYCPTTVREYLPEGIELETCRFHRNPGRVDLPAIYAPWAMGFEKSSGHADTGDVIIEYPRDGAVFYVDPSAPADQQRIPFKITTGESASTRILVQGEPVHVMRGSGVWRMAPKRGTWTVTVEYEGKTRSVTVTVY
jgi:hypothetical protein